MLYRRKGFPQKDEILLCTIKKILPNSVFVVLDEYKDLEGMIRIPEIAPGRIRNIRDFVKEGKKIVCKVLKSDSIKKHVDLSLRRVQQSVRIKKTNEIKQEVKAERLLEGIAKQLKLKSDELYKKTMEKISEDYDMLHFFFQDIATDQADLNKIKLDKKIENILTKTIKDRIKPQEFKLKAIFNISNKEGEGILKIKQSIKKTLELAKQKNYKIKITYLGSPKYEMDISSTDYKSAENILTELAENLTKNIKTDNGDVEWEKKS